MKPYTLVPILLLFTGCTATSVSYQDEWIKSTNNAVDVSIQATKARMYHKDQAEKFKKGILQLQLLALAYRRAIIKLTCPVKI